MSLTYNELESTLKDLTFSGLPENFIDHTIKNAHNSILENINRIFEEELKKNCAPSIKGEITIGKLKWRGVKRIQSQDGYSWFEQRGRQVTSKIEYPNFKGMTISDIHNNKYEITANIIYLK